MPTLDQLLAGMKRQVPAEDRDVAAAESALGRRLPEDYITLMRDGNGGEGPVGEHGFLRIWPLAEVVDQTRRYARFDQFEDLVVFGTDGGGEAFCFDTVGRYLAVPFVGGREDRTIAGDSLGNFLRKLGDGEI
jgi:hypothetical protein